MEYFPNLPVTLIFRCYPFCCSMEYFRKEIMQLKKNLENNGYDNTFLGRCHQTLLNKIYCKKVPQHKVPKQGIYIFLHYLGKLWLSARSTLEKTICDIFSHATLKVVLITKITLSSKFTFKDKISKEIRSLLYYNMGLSACTGKI